MSLRLKISLLSALITGGILLGFGFASWILIYRERVAAVDREIRTLAARHPGWLANRANPERLTSMLEFTFGEHRKDRVILSIRERSGAVLYQSPHWPAGLDPGPLHATIPGDARNPVSPDRPAPVSESPPPGRPGGFGPGHGRGPMGPGPGRGTAGVPVFTTSPTFLTAAAAAGPGWRLGLFGSAQTTLLLGINSDDVQGELQHLRNKFLLVFPIALLLAGVGGWTVGARALRPLTTIAEIAERVTARGLDQRISLSNSDAEAARVVRVLNGMMDRLEKSFHQATRFTADASHELKTPLTIMQGELESALQRVSPASPEEQTLSNLLEEVQRLKNITRNLLLLAQADAGELKRAIERVDLTDLLRNAVEDARVLASELDLAVEEHIHPGLTVSGDKILLSTAILNLVGNAVKYNEPAGRIALQAEQDGSQIVITIANTGPGIGPEDQPRIFDRFFRGSQSDHGTPEGIGLGLSLAKEIILAHGGELALRESRPGWTCFSVKLLRGDG